MRVLVQLVVTCSQTKDGQHTLLVSASGGRLFLSSVAGLDQCLHVIK